jgi:hypothetical protein
MFCSIQKCSLNGFVIHRKHGQNRFVVLREVKRKQKWIRKVLCGTPDDIEPETGVYPDTM